MGKKNAIRFIKSEELLKDPKGRAALQRVDLEYETSRAITNIRMDRGWTQAELAKRIGTTQSSVARAERLDRVPSVRFLTKIAKATNTRLVIRFEKF